MLLKKSILVLALTGFMANASAISLSLVPSSSIVDRDETFTVDLMIGDLNGETIGAWFSDIAYDTQVLSFDNYSLSDNLGALSTNGLDGFAFDFSFGEEEPGLINLASLSDLDTEELDLIQDNQEFSLATLTFTNIAIPPLESTIISIVQTDFANGDGGSFFLDETFDAEVTATPIPGTAALFATGLLGIGALRKRRAK